MMLHTFKPPRRQSNKARQNQAAWNRITRLKINVGVGCEAKADECDGLDLQGHHKLARRFGDYSESNHLLVCARCHGAINANPAWAIRRGFVVLGNGLPPMRERTVMSEVREDAEAKALRLGLDLIKPGPSDVFVDLDSIGERLEFKRRLLLAQKLWPETTVRFTDSSSGKPGRAHAYVTIPELAPLAEDERIALQAALNSDPFREMLAIFHGRAGYQHTSVFFEKPVTAELGAEVAGKDS